MRENYPGPNNQFDTLKNHSSNLQNFHIDASELVLASTSRCTTFTQHRLTFHHKDKIHISQSYTCPLSPPHHFIQHPSPVFPDTTSNPRQSETSNSTPNPPPSPNPRT